LNNIDKKLSFALISISVDSTNVTQIAEAFRFLIDNPIIAEEMGTKGRSLVETKFNWSQEEIKLIDLYNTFKEMGGL